MPEETTVPTVAAKAAPAAKKPKEPTIEEKPFPEFIQEHFLPALQTAFSKEEPPEDPKISFTQAPISIAKTNLEKSCSQVIGRFADGRQFNLYFLDEDISGQKAFSYSRGGKEPSTLESFMIDERKVNLDLLLMYTLQRLNGQKWLSRN